MRRPWSQLAWIAAVVMLAVAVLRPNAELSLYRYTHPFSFSQGLDLQGGVYLKYILDLGGVQDQTQAIQGVKDVVERRINPLGVIEPVIQTSKIGNDTALIVELPGVKDVQQAIDSIGQTAKLTFQTYDQTTQGFAPTNLTGADLKAASVGRNQTTGAVTIELSFNSIGTQKFASITSQNVGKPLAIYLDSQPLQIATVQEAITGGQAEITGNFTITEAQSVVRLLNAGALPVPLKLAEQQTIGATLGQDSINRSLIAGIIGFLLVITFLVLYYRILGAIAAVALTIYVLISLAVLKAIPITLTLSGITGFILSIGMAVDANILIFERTKEERASGKAWYTALTEGFNRAMPSIRDSNLSSIITALILYNFGSSSLVRNFAVTLIIGIIISLFSAITVTRTLMLLVAGTKLLPINQDKHKPETGERGEPALAPTPQPATDQSRSKTDRRSRW